MDVKLHVYLLVSRLCLCHRMNCWAFFSVVTVTLFIFGGVKWQPNALLIYVCVCVILLQFHASKFLYCHQCVAGQSAFSHSYQFPPLSCMSSLCSIPVTFLWLYENCLLDICQIKTWHDAVVSLSLQTHTSTHAPTHSPTHTRTHTHTLSLSLSHTHTHTHTLSLSLSLSLTHTHTHTHTHTLSLSHTPHTHTHTRRHQKLLVTSRQKWLIVNAVNGSDTARVCLGPLFSCMTVENQFSAIAWWQISMFPNYKNTYGYAQNGFRVAAKQLRPLFHVYESGLKIMMKM